MIIWIGRPSQKYFATKDDLVSVLQQVATEFPDVRLADSAEMEDLIAKDLAYCACGWHRTDVFNGTTWKTSQSVANLPLAISYPSNPSSGPDCGDGKRKMMSCSTTGGFNKGKGGLYVTFYGTEEFADQKLSGLGFTSKIVESHQQIVEKPVPEDCGVSNFSAWSKCSKPCGPGKHTRTRYVETVQKWGGKACPVLSETQDCQIKPCPIDCTVSGFSGWSKCDKECGPGHEIRTRTITRKDKYGGKICPELSESRDCQIKSCAVDCEVSGWSSWSGCSKTCGPGTQTSTRTVTTAPQHGGQACPALSRSQSCNNGRCTSIRVRTDSFGGGASVTSDYACKNMPDGNGQIHYTAHSRAYATDSDCGASDQCMLQVTDGCHVRTHKQNRCKSARNWDDWSSWASFTPNSSTIGPTTSNHGCTSTIISEGLGQTSRDPMNNFQYLCSTGGSAATYNASTLTSGQKAEAARAWPGKPPSYYACVQSCGGTCDKNGKGVMAEHFTGGMKEGFAGREGYAPLQGDFVTACQDSGTRGGKPVPGVKPTGNFLVENRRKERDEATRLKSMQQQIKNSINEMQSKNLEVSSLYRTKNTNLLKQLASYGMASHKLLNMSTNFDTLGAQEADSLLRKKSVDLSYYLWLTLAISILGIAITKIK